MAMKRRAFTTTVIAAVAGSVLPAAAKNRASRPEVAITIDDLNRFPNPLFTHQGVTSAILSALEKHGVKAGMFAIGRNVEDDAGRAILKACNDAGHSIGNHTYSHRNFNSREMTVQAFAEDIQRCHDILKSCSGFRKFFRFPMLHEGNTREKRDGLRAFLRENDYRNGHVTIDTSDWYIDQRLRERLAKNKDADLTPYKNYYLAHIWERTQFYHGLALKLLRRNVRHTLLIHHNPLNALYLADILQLYERNGWKLINVEQAYEDPIFTTEPNTLPAGESIVWAHAKESGRFDKILRYPGEDAEYEKAKMARAGL